MKTLIKAFLSAMILFWLFHLISFSELVSDFKKTNWTWLLGVWFVQMLLVLVQTERWRIIANRLDIQFRFSPSLQNVLIGLFFNQVFPSAIGGDAVRIWRLQRQSIPITLATISIILDRFVALFSILLIVLAGSGLLFNIIPPGPPRQGLIVLILGFAIGFVTLLSFDYIPLPSQVMKFKIVQRFLMLPASARHIFLSWGGISRTTCLSILIQAGVAFSFWLLAQGLGVTSAKLLDFIVLTPLVTLVTTVPLSIGGWGLREGAMIAAMALIGIPASAALIMSIEFGLIMMLIALPGGVLCILDTDGPRALASLPPRLASE